MRRLEKRDEVVAEEADEDDEEDDDKGRGRFFLLEIEEQAVGATRGEEAGHLVAVAAVSSSCERWGDDMPQTGGSFIAAPLGVPSLLHHWTPLDSPLGRCPACPGVLCVRVCGHACVDCEERVP